MSLLTEKALLVRATIRGKSWGRSKQDKAAGARAAADNGAEEASVRLVKTLVPKSFTEGLTEVGNAAYALHRKLTLPWSDEGERILTTAAHEEYMGAMSEFAERYHEAARKLHQSYDDVKADARIRLGALFNEKDFRSAERLFALSPDTGRYINFQIAVSRRAIDEGKDLRIDLNEAEVKKIADEIRRENEAAIQAAVSDAWSRLKGPIEHMATMLAKYENGETRAIQEAWVTNVREIAKLIPKLNLTGDPEMDRIAKEAALWLTQWNQPQLKDSPGTRKVVRTKAEELLAQMAGYCGEIDLGLEEAA